MSIFSEAELAYMRTQNLARLATVDRHGRPQVKPVNFSYNEKLDTIDIYGYDMSSSAKYRNIERTGFAAFVIDDVLPPWKARMLEVRGRAKGITDPEAQGPRGEEKTFIRIYPERIIFYDQTQPEHNRN